jgi:hypothetical protein
MVVDVGDTLVDEVRVVEVTGIVDVVELREVVDVDDRLDEDVVTIGLQLPGETTLSSNVTAAPA